MSERSAARDTRGQATMEYVMLLGLITAGALLLLKLLYSGQDIGQDIESLVNAWGGRLANQIAGDEMGAGKEDAWAGE